MIVDTSERRIHVESSQPQRVKEGIITLRCDKHALIMKTSEAVKLAEWILIVAKENKWLKASGHDKLTNS